MTRHKMITTTALALAALLAAAGIAAAQGGGANIGGHVGMFKPEDADESTFLFGAHAELRPIPWLGVQGSVDYWLADEYEIMGTEWLKIRSVPVTVTARLYPLATEQVSIFAAAGAGWYHLVYDYSSGLEDFGADDFSENTFGWHVGAGIVLPVSPAASLYAEGRAIFVDPDQDIDDELVDEVEDLDYDSTYFVAGMNLEF